MVEIAGLNCGGFVPWHAGQASYQGCCTSHHEVIFLPAAAAAAAAVAAAAVVAVAFGTFVDV